MHIAIDVAQGMNYLHSLEPQIIHRDLKSGNVLLDKNFSAKVCDFGLSFNKKGGEGDAAKHGIMGTPEFMAPEVMNDQSYNQKVDVYSYGIVLCELFSRIKPYSDQFKIDNFLDAVDLILDGGALPTIPSWCGPQIKDLILRCLRREPSERPSFSTIVTTLRAIYDGTPTASLFLTYEVSRILEMLYNSNELFQEIACKDIAEIQIRSKSQFDCQRCGFMPSESDKFSMVDQQTMSLMVVRITTFFSSKEESLILQSTRAFAEILADSNSNSITQYRAVLRENGALKRILVFLNSTNVDVKQNASRIMTLLTNDLDSDEQVKFVDLSYAGLSSLAALSGGYRGLSKLKHVVEEETQLLIKKRQELEEIISKKSQFVNQLAAAEDTMKTKFESESASTLKRGTLHNRLLMEKLSTLQKQHSFRLKGSTKIMGDEIKQALATLSPSHSNESNLDAIEFENSEIPLMSKVPDSFLEYYGDFKRTFHAYAVKWDSDKERWELRYLFLYGDEIRTFVTHESEPDDPINVLYVGNDANPSATATPTEAFGNFNGLEIKVGGSLFQFGFRTKHESLVWANLIDPDVNPPPKERTPHKEENDGKTLSSLLSAVLKESQEEALQIAKSMPTLSKLPETFAEYFEGMEITSFGYLAVNDVISGHWVHRFCLLVNGVLRVFGSHTDPPDDCQMILYISGSFASAQFELAVPKDPKGEWGAQSFAMKDDAGTYYICSKSGQDRDKWTTAVNPNIE